MKTNPLDIELRLKLCCENEFPAEYVMTALQCVNEAYFASELSDLRKIRKEFPHLPNVALDAAEHRIKTFKKSSVNIRAVKKGSIEFAIVATGLTVWILQQTLGETLKQSWLESNMHKKLKNFLTKDRFNKVERLREDSRKRLSSKLPCEVGVDHQRSRNDEQDEGEIITLQVKIFPERKYPPRRGELFENDEPHNNNKIG